MVYVEGVFDTARLSQYQMKEQVIQKGDLLSIIVFSDNPEATALYNVSNSTQGAQGANGSGYLVDTRGNIQFQGVGSLHVEGLSKNQLVDVLNSKLSLYLKNPYYNIRFLNNRITLLGEVNKEGTYQFPAEKINIFEAIGLAGGLTIYARRETVLIIREANNKREFVRLDLTKPEVLASPYYFLQQNDMIIVDPVKGKYTANEQIANRNIMLAATIVSTIALVYSILRQY